MDEILKEVATPKQIKDDFIAKAEVAKSVLDETKGPMFKSGFPEGALKGVPLSQAGRGICNLLAWLNDNYANVILTFELGWFGPLAGYKIYDKDGALVHEEKPVAMRGTTTETNPVAQIEELGRQMLTKLVYEVAKERGLDN